MATPTQPLGLSAAAIAVLQARQAQPREPDADKASTPAIAAPRPTTAAHGRGRFIDLLA